MYIDYTFSCDMQKLRHKQLKYRFKQTDLLFCSHRIAIAGTAIFETTENTLDINIPPHMHNGIQKNHLFGSIKIPKYLFDRLIGTVLITKSQSLVKPEGSLPPLPKPTTRSYTNLSRIQSTYYESMSSEPFFNITIPSMPRPTKQSLAPSVPDLSFTCI